MKHILFRELKLNLKTFLIWSLSVGLMGLVCILLYQSMEGDMKDIQQSCGNSESKALPFTISVDLYLALTTFVSLLLVLSTVLPNISTK